MDVQQNKLIKEDRCILNAQGRRKQREQCNSIQGESSAVQHALICTPDTSMDHRGIGLWAVAIGLATSAGCIGLELVVESFLQIRSCLAVNVFHLIGVFGHVIILVEDGRFVVESPVWVELCVEEVVGGIH
eukprot:scpid13732/ scgid30189/ 